MKKEFKMLGTRAATLFVVTMCLLMFLSMAAKVQAAIALTPIEDATVSSCMPDLNEGKLIVLFVWTGYCERWAYLKFDLSELPPIQIINAVLWLYCRYDDSGPPVNVEVCEASNLWTEDTITWNTKPLGDPGPMLATTMVSGSLKWYRWESLALTDYVTAHVGGNMSLIVKLPVVGIEPIQRAFSSREFYPESPLLDINPDDPKKRSIGGLDLPVNRFAIFVPYVALASAISMGTFTTFAIAKQRREK